MEILSVAKALALLDLLAFADLEEKGMTLSELSRRTGEKPTTLHNILRTMIRWGYAEQDGQSRYHAGKRCRQIGVVNRFRMTPSMAGLLQEEMASLCRRIGESVSFYLLENGDRINYTNLESGGVIKVDFTMLEEDSLYSYPTGKVLVACCSSAELEAILQKHGLPRERWAGIRTREQLEREREALRLRGYADRTAADGQVYSCAVPVCAAGRLLGTLGAYMPAFRVDEAKRELVIQSLLASARTIEERSRAL